MIDVRPYCERWVRWASGSRSYGISMTGKLMSGMRSTKCPTCSARGRVEGWKVGSTDAWVDPCPSCGGSKKVSGELSATLDYEIADCGLCVDEETLKPTGVFLGEPCRRCKGKKKYRRLLYKVNPAGIRATRYAGANEDDDPVSAAIDRTVAGWSQSFAMLPLHIVIMMEYTQNGTQNAKARAWRKSLSFYAKRLHQAHELLEPVIEIALTY